MEDQLPEGIALDRHRDLGGRLHAPWTRRALLCCVAALPILALLNVFGQHPSTSSASGPAASISITAPTRLRGGVLFQARIRLIAHQTIEQPTLVFDEGWWESMGVNSTIPEPTEEKTKEGRVELIYDKLDAGRSMTVWINFQVNPTNVGSRSENIELDDEETPLLTVHRSLTIFP